MCSSLSPHGLQHARLLCPLLSPRVYSKSCPLSQWCYLSASSAAPFSLCLQSFPASGSFLVSQIFVSGGLSIGASASASVLPMNSQDWFPLGWTGWICLQSKGLSRVFSSTTVQTHQFFAISFLCSLKAIWKPSITSSYESIKACKAIPSSKNSHKLSTLLC